MHLEHIDHLTSMIDELDTLIERVLAPFAQQMSLLRTIPGIGERAAQVIISENGVDMSRFPTAAHLASWAGLCPGNNESAGKHESGRTRQGNQEVACARWRSTCWTRQKGQACRSVPARWCCNPVREGSPRSSVARTRLEATATETGAYVALEVPQAGAPRRGMCTMPRRRLLWQAALTPWGPHSLHRPLPGLPESSRHRSLTASRG